MGWLYCKPTRDALVDHLLQAHGAHLERVDHAQRGNNLWVLYRVRADAECFIVLYRMEGVRGDHPSIRWGYKDVVETMGPTDETCPARLLRGSTDQSPVAQAWRERCHAHHANQRQQAAFVRSLKPGDLFAYGSRIARFRGISSYSGKPLGVALDDGIQYAFKPCSITRPPSNPLGDLSEVMTLLRDEFTARFGARAPTDSYAIVFRVHSSKFGWSQFVACPNAIAELDLSHPVTLYATSPAVEHSERLPNHDITHHLRMIAGLARADANVDMPTAKCA